MSSESIANFPSISLIPPILQQEKICRLSQLYNIPKLADCTQNFLMPLTSFTIEQIDAIAKSTYDRKFAIAMVTFSNDQAILTLECRTASVILSNNKQGFTIPKFNTGDCLINPLPTNEYLDLIKKVAKYRLHNIAYQIEDKEADAEGMPEITLGRYAIIQIKAVTWNLDEQRLTNVFQDTHEDVFKEYVKKGVYAIKPLARSVMKAVVSGETSKIKTPLVFESLSIDSTNILHIYNKGVSWLIGGNLSRFQLNMPNGKNLVWENQVVNVLSIESYNRILTTIAKTYCIKMLEKESSRLSPVSSKVLEKQSQAKKEEVLLQPLG